MTERRILVCGSREWPGTWEDIGRHFPEPAPEDDVTIIHGACSQKVLRGVGRRYAAEVSVDMLADYCASGRRRFAVERYPVDHAIDGPWPAAGPRRNRRMLVTSKPTDGLAYGALWRWRDHENHAPHAPAGRYTHTGTGGMVALMLAARLPVRWVATPDAAPVDIVTMPGPPGHA